VQRDRPSCRSFQVPKPSTPHWIGIGFATLDCPRVLSSAKSSAKPICASSILTYAILCDATPRRQGAAMDGARAAAFMLRERGGKTVSGTEASAGR
jgi:hypothetical protein